MWDYRDKGLRRGCARRQCSLQKGTAGKRSSEDSGGQATRADRSHIDNWIYASTGQKPWVLRVAKPIKATTLRTTPVMNESGVTTNKLSLAY